MVDLNKSVQDTGIALEKPSVYTNEQKEADKLMLHFMNLAKYIEIIDAGTNSKEGSIIDTFLTDNELSNFNDKRLKFYHQFFRSVNNDPRTVQNVLKVHSYIKGLKKEEREVLKQIFGYLEDSTHAKTDKNVYIQKLFDKIKNDEVIQQQSSQPDQQNQTRGGTMSESDYSKKYIDNIESKNIESKNIESDGNLEDHLKNLVKKKPAISDDTEDNLRGILKLEYGFDNVNNLNQNIYKEDTADTKVKDDNAIQQFIEDYEGAFDNDEGIERTTAIKNAVEKLENSRENVLENLRISREDRLVFILTTFLIRYVTMNLVQWCIDINFIKDFYEGFILFAVIYNVIFWLIIMFVNINTLPSVTYMNLRSDMGMIRSLFYYFYMGTNGIMRLITHSVILIVILLIPVIININAKNPNKDDRESHENQFLSMEEKKKLIKLLSLLTIFVWIFTSIIAIKF